MSRSGSYSGRQQPRFPRVSGDEPLIVFAPPHVLMFSPRERG